MHVAHGPYFELEGYHLEQQYSLIGNQYLSDCASAEESAYDHGACGLCAKMTALLAADYAEQKKTNKHEPDCKHGYDNKHQPPSVVGGSGSRFLFAFAFVFALSLLFIFFLFFLLSLTITTVIFENVRWMHKIIMDLHAISTFDWTIIIVI
jgi:hypothetical protein